MTHLTEQERKQFEAEINQEMKPLLDWGLKNNIPIETFRDCTSIMKKIMHNAHGRVMRVLVEMTPEQFAQEQVDMKKDLATGHWTS